MATYTAKSYSRFWGVVDENDNWVVDAEWSQEAAVKIAARLNRNPHIDVDVLFEGLTEAE